MVYKAINSYILPIIIICVLICDANGSITPEGNRKNARKNVLKPEETSRHDPFSLQEIRSEPPKISPEFHSIFEDIEKIRNSLFVNDLGLPYEEIFYFGRGLQNRHSSIESPKVEEKVDKNLIDVLDEKSSSDNDTSFLMYNKGINMLKSYRSNKKDAYSLLLNASNMGNNQAKAEVAWGLIYGTHMQQNITSAKKMFEELAEEGEAEGHTGLGFLHSIGLDVKRSQARALVHYTIGALGGNNRARLILGFKYWMGITVPANCERALEFYRLVASHVASEVDTNGGVVVHRIRLLDEAENPGYQTGLIERDLREYYEMMADKGDVAAQLGLGQLYYRGARGFPKDYKKALMYFKKAAISGNPTGMAFAGKIYLEGDENVEMNLLNAYLNFKKAADLGNPIGQFGLGMMYLEGKHMEKNSKKAIFYLTRSADQGWVESLLVLGTMYLQGKELKKDYRMARKNFMMAAQIGHILGLYNLGQMHASGVGTMRSCTTAVDLFKNVAERGKWGVLLMEAYGNYHEKKFSEAFVIYALLAEMGYEAAQNNAAFLLDRGLYMFDNEDERQRYSRAQVYWARSAMQGNPEAVIKLGDYFYYGLAAKVDYETAVSYYRIASHHFRSPQAMFNLGYMHEQGLGLKQDLHLAKRCYDMAAEASPDAEFPVLLALIKLYLVTAAHSFKEADWSQLLALRGLNAYLGHNWDIYLGGFLIFCAAYILHFRVNRRDLVRDLINFL